MTSPWPTLPGGWRSAKSPSQLHEIVSPTSDVLDLWRLRTVQTFRHVADSRRMDPMAVTDQHLRVRDVEGLWMAERPAERTGAG